MKHLKVLITDDHKIIRDGIAALIDGTENIQVVGQAANGKEAFEMVEMHQPDVVIMDVSMPELNGMEATKMITDKYPDVKILAFTMHNDKRWVTDMLDAGASGYIMKDTGIDELVKAIQSLYAGDSYFNEKIASMMMATFMKGSKNNADENLDKTIEITRREEEVLTLIADEMTNIEIADKLFISPHTVDTHRRNLLHKLDVKNTVGLVKYAYLNGLVA